MGIFDDESIDRVGEFVYGEYFDNKNTIISSIKFMKFLDDHLQPCNKRSKGSFVFVFWNSSQATFMFVKEGYIYYSLYYKSHPYLFHKDKEDGIIQSYDYTSEPRRYEFEKYNFGEWDRMEYYHLESTDLDLFYNIIFNRDENN